MATITFQNLFMQFERFSGMTATGKLAEKEFFDLYSKIVIQIPTSNPVIRRDLPDKVFLRKFTCRRHSRKAFKLHKEILEGNGSHDTHII
jgi:preprotein translocase subunit SecA